MVKAKLKKKKRKWFTIKPKEEYKNKIIGEVLAYEPIDLVGRKITISYGDLSDNPKDNKNKIKFEIVEIKEGEGLAEPRGIYVQDTFIDQRTKRDKSKGLLVIKEKTKDGKNIKLKIAYSSRNKISNSSNAKIQKQLEAYFRELLNKNNTNKLFDVSYTKKETNLIKDKTRKTYPIDKLYIWKLSII